VGLALVQHLTAAGFQGQASLVNPRLAAAGVEVLGLSSYPSVTAVPYSVDLAVVAVPAEQVLAVVDDCARAEVKGLVVVTSGFGETGEEGRARQRQLVDRARAGGMRVIGPNCLGVINTDPTVSLNASLAPGMPRRARIGFFSQSGALGVSLLETVVARGLGLSSFVSAGNRADVSGNDLIQYWEDDPATDVLLLYLESIGNPRKFTRIARRTSARKPIVAVKSGRSSQGIPLGHTVRASALPAAAVDEMFRQSGVIQVDTLTQLFDVATVLTFQPLPRGPRVSVIGNSDALAVLAADACETQGLDLVGDPVTFWPGAGPDDYGRALAAVEADPAVDAVIVLYLAPVGTDGSGVARELARAAARGTKPILATVLAVDGLAALIHRMSPDGIPMFGSVPSFGSVEDAARALAAVTTYAQWRATPRAELPPLADTDPGAARAVVERVLAAQPEGGMLQGHDLTEVLRCYGINLWPSVFVTTADEAVEAATRLGYPVVLKVTAPHLLHRTDLGGVRLDVPGEAALRRAFEALHAELGDEVTSTLVVQRMAGRGVACVIGSTEDALFGPVVSFGVGGVVTELVEDRGYRIPPLDAADAADLVRSPLAAPLLFGYRGAPAMDTGAVERLLLRVGKLAYDLPELAALELNPVLALPTGAAVLSASARLLHPLARRDRPARRLP
jgi:acyl-CoA synthetase (NDP forming)